jgi:Fur family transcriptional regulator, peroxide stress response regulator
MSKAEQMARFSEQCQAHSLKLTPQRLVIYETLITSTLHPSAEQIYQAVNAAFPMISLDTVHRTLNTFCAIGVAVMVEGTGSPQRYEGNLDNHHHIRCVRCGQILDVYNPTYDGLELPPEVPADFQVLRKTVQIVGLCHACQQGAAEDGNSRGVRPRGKR